MVTRIPETWKRTTSFLRLMASNYQAKTSHQKGETWWNRKPTKCKGQRSWFPSKVPFRAQKVLVIFQASQKLAKTNISSVIRHQRNSNNLLLMSLCRTQHPKAALERTVFEEAANCAVTPPRGEGWTPRSSFYKLRVSFVGFCWSVQIVPFFVLTLCGSRIFKLILRDCLLALRDGTEGSWVCIHSIFDGVWPQNVEEPGSEAVTILTQGIVVEGHPHQGKVLPWKRASFTNCSPVCKRQKKQKKPHHLQRWKAWIIHKSGETLK